MTIIIITIIMNNKHRINEGAIQLNVEQDSFRKYRELAGRKHLQ